MQTVTLAIVLLALVASASAFLAVPSTALTQQAEAPRCAPLEGRGDRRTKKGKIRKHSNGKSRPKPGHK